MDMQERWKTTVQNGRLKKLVTDLQKDVVAYLKPDGINKDDFISRVIERLDGPQSRSALDDELEGS